MKSKLVPVMDLPVEEREALFDKKGAVVEYFDKGEIILTGERERFSRWPIAEDGKAYHPRHLFVRMERTG